MSAPRILYRYIAREIASYTLIAGLLFALVLMTGDVGTTIMPLLSLGISWIDILRLCAVTFPMILSYAIPIAFTFGMLAAYGRLSADSEVIAMRTSGIHMGHLLLPSMCLGVLFCFLIGFFSIYVEAPTRARSRTMLTEVALRNLSLVPGRFHTVEGRVLLVDKKDDDETLHGIFIADSSNRTRPLEIFAEKGTLTIDKQNAAFEFQLSDGQIHLPDTAEDCENYKLITFEQMKYSFHVGELMLDNGPSWRPRDQTTKELREILSLYREKDAPLPKRLEHIRRKLPVDFQMEYGRRFAMPVIPLLFPLLCVPLGLRRHRDASSAGVLHCLGIIFFYYILRSFGESLGERGVLPAFAAVWLPNLLLGLASIPLLVRSTRSN